MSSVDRWAMSVYDQHVPGAREARLTDAMTHYTRSLMSHILGIAEIAMRMEEIPEEARRRILLTIAIGQPSSPVDTELRLLATKQLTDLLARQTPAFQWLDEPPTQPATEDERNETPR